MLKKRHSREQALQKLKHYCAYQERCHTEVKEKLYSFGLFKSEVEEIISLLIEENYLNEERFAMHYAGGKFRMKHWGRIKIRHSLKQKQVSEYCIKKALAEIDEDEYNRVAKKLIEEKATTLKGNNRFVVMARLMDYMLQKGYERNLILELIKDAADSRK